MSAALGFSEGEDQPFTAQFLREFLLRVPVAVLFDNEFNANATSGFVLNDFPIIRHYDFLHNMLLNLLEGICNFAFCVETTSKGKVLAYRKDFLDRSSNYYKFVTSQINELLVYATGNIDSFRIETFGVPNNNDDKLFIMGPAVTFYKIANSFVWIHEFAHILFGDVTRIWEPEMEYRCDRFAASCVNNSPGFQRAEVIFSIDFILILLKILVETQELIENKPNQNSSFILQRARELNEFLYKELNNSEIRRYNYFSQLMGPIIF
ncbi:MAG: hypothetical protein ABII72_02835 [Parcubacteria group bacterium]